MIRAALTFFLFTAFAGGALADAPGVPRMPKPLLEKPAPAASMESWGLKNVSCAEWTNACQVCSRDATGKPQCSTSGIACTPKAMVCSKPK